MPDKSSVSQVFADLALRHLTETFLVENTNFSDILKRNVSDNLDQVERVALSL